MRNNRLLSLMLSGTLFLSCSGLFSSDDEDNNPRDVVNSIADLTVKQENWFSQFEAIAAETGVVPAMDTVARIIATDTSVAHVYTFKQGINVELKNGLGGTLLLNPHRGDSGTTGTGFNIPNGSLRKKTGKSDDLQLPKGKKTVFISAMYDEFGPADEALRQVGNENFPQVDYDDFEFYKGSECTVERITSLGGSDYSFIRLASHGVPWPNEDSCVRVYFVTGETTTEKATTAFSAELQAGGIRIITSQNKISYYEISADYFASKTNWGESKPFVSLGFCYSYFGGWPSKCIGAGAGGILGYNWSIREDKDLEWTADFITKMCDTTLDFPYFLKKWYDQAEKSFFDEELSVTVSVYYKGKDSLAFWKPFRLLALMPSAALCGDTILAVGVQFGDTTGKVLFNDKSGEVLDWTDSIIEVVVPQGFSSGQSVPVKVVAHQDTTNEKILVISRLAYNTCDVGIKVFGYYTTSDGPLESWVDIRDLIPGSTQGGIFTGTLQSGGTTTRIIVNFDPQDGKMISASYTSTSGSGFTKVTLGSRDADAFNPIGLLWQGDASATGQIISNLEDEVHTENYNAKLDTWTPTGKGGQGSFKVYLYKESR